MQVPAKARAARSCPSQGEVGVSVCVTAVRSMQHLAVRLGASWVTPGVIREQGRGAGREVSAANSHHADMFSRAKSGAQRSGASGKIILGAEALPQATRWTEASVSDREAFQDAATRARAKVVDIEPVGASSSRLPKWLEKWQDEFPNDTRLSKAQQSWSAGAHIEYCRGAGF